MKENYFTMSTNIFCIRKHQSYHYVSFKSNKYTNKKQNINKSMFLMQAVIRRSKFQLVPKSKALPTMEMNSPINVNDIQFISPRMGWKTNLVKVSNTF